MKSALYAGSFDPWSKGHQFVLNAALNIFEKVHILVAINPAKHGTIETKLRAQSIAHCINPLILWEKETPPYVVNEKVVINYTTGLVVSYAQENQIKYLIRGLRSTSDFEAEFGLYFSNLAINNAVQTWCVLCPPDLLHCSSTFIRNVVGHSGIDFVGTSFLTQAHLLQQKTNLAHLLDLIDFCTQNLTESTTVSLLNSDSTKELQKLFVFLYSNVLLSCFNADTAAEKFLHIFISKHKQNRSKSNKFSRADITWLAHAVMAVLTKSTSSEIASKAITYLNKISVDAYSPEKLIILEKEVGL